MSEQAKRMKNNDEQKANLFKAKTTSKKKFCWNIDCSRVYKVGDGYWFVIFLFDMHIDLFFETTKHDFEKNQKPWN